MAQAPDEDTAAQPAQPPRGQRAVPLAAETEALTPEAWAARLERMSTLFAGMMDTAQGLEGKRCPYKNKDDRCTAKFGCRNQRVPPEGKRSGAPFVCGADDKLDWRSAWDV